jgi:signal transduction histidine kinase
LAARIPRIQDLLGQALQTTMRAVRATLGSIKATQEQLVRGETLRAIGQLASGMAHHLNNLFAVILGRTELLLGTTEAPVARRSLEIVRRAAEDGADVTRRVQRFSRLHPLSEPVAVDVNQLDESVVELTRAPQDEAQRSGHLIDVTVEPGAVLPTIGETAPVREALMNLVLNAIDVMPEGGRATIRTLADAGHVRCAVIDTGVGMSEDVRRRALQPFFTRKGPKRTGLGLSMAYGAVQRYGGALEIDSAPERGTTVTISLPVAVPRSKGEGDLESVAAPAAG